MKIRASSTLYGVLLILGVSLLVVSLLGCGSSVTTSIPAVPSPPAMPAPVTGTYAGSSFGGRVFAGSAPVSGAAVQFYAAGSVGNGLAAGPLLASVVLTNAAGVFTIPATYSCPSAGTQVYLIARGGTPTGTTNAIGALELLTAVGRCDQIAATTQVVLNEVTTVAAAWALAQFLGPGGTIGASATNEVGLANSFQLAANLAASAGPSPGTTLPLNVTYPVARINTMANLLYTCTASNAGSACGQLFAAASLADATSPTNTLDAALFVVHHSALNVPALYALSRAGTAYSPALPSAPSDWTLFLTIAGGGLNAPATVGLTSSGGVWVSNYFDVASSFTALGAPVFSPGVTGYSLDHSYGLAVDTADNAWISNEDKSVITKLSNAGVSESGATGFSGGGIDFPLAVAIDPDSSVWIADYGNAHVSRLSAAGVSLAGANGISSDQIAFPVAIAIDAEHNGWIANSEGTTVTRLSQDGTNAASATCCNGPDGIAIDQRGSAWVSNFYGNSVSQISSSLSVVSPGYAAPALARPQGIAIDGVGNVWVASFRGLGIVELAGSQNLAPGTVLSPPVGWAHDAPLLEPYSLAIDASGNLWIANFGSSTLTQIVGLASPVKTPLLGPPQTP